MSFVLTPKLEAKFENSFTFLVFLVRIEKD